MSSRIAFSAALLLAAAPALAQQPATTAQQPAQPAPAASAAQPSAAEIAAIQTGAQAFGICVQSGVQSVPASATPEAGAASVQATCATQRQALVHAVEAMLANMPEPQRTQGHAQMESQLAQVPTQIADAIRAQRAAAAAPATPTPATTPVPPPPPH